MNVEKGYIGATLSMWRQSKKIKEAHNIKALPQFLHGLHTERGGASIMRSWIFFFIFKNVFWFNAANSSQLWDTELIFFSMIH